LRSKKFDGNRIVIAGAVKFNVTLIEAHKIGAIA
jgi:hypothetical protein